MKKFMIIIASLFVAGSIVNAQVIIQKSAFDVGVPARTTNIKSSSFLIEDGVDGYHKPRHACDADWDTAWVVRTEKSGIGEWMSVEFSDWNNSGKFECTHVKLERLSIANGFVKNKNLYYANNRVKKLEFEFDTGDKEIAVLKDGIVGYQRVEFKKVIWCKWVKITILEVYKGSKYDDTCIGEIIFEDSRDYMHIMQGKRE